MSAPDPVEKGKTTPVLRLPTIGHEGQPGASFVRRAVGLTLGTLALLAAIALVVSFLVSMDVTVKAAGVLEPVRIWPVRSLESGTVREVLVETGDTVAAGAPMVRLDPLDLETQLAQLKAQRASALVDRQRSSSNDPLARREQRDRIAQAQARLVTARATLRQRMVEYDLGTNVDSLLQNHRPGRHVALDLAVGEVRGAEAELRLGATQADALSLSRFDREKTDAEIARLDAQIRATEVRLGRLEMRAPAAGVVLTERIERLTGAAVGQGDQLLEVADLDDWRVTLMVRERDIHKIRVGDEVKVEVQAFSAAERELLRGRVTYVSPEPLGASQSDAGSAAQEAASAGLYRVTARLDHAELVRVGIDKFRRGYSVQGNVITRSGKISTLLWHYIRDRFDRGGKKQQ